MGVSNTPLGCYDGFSPSMTTVVPDILARIVEQKRVELRAEKDFLPVLEKEAEAAGITDRVVVLEEGVTKFF